MRGEEDRPLTSEDGSEVHGAERWDDLRARLEQADAALQVMYDEAFRAGSAPDPKDSEFNAAVCRRVSAKQSGIRLALDYMRGYGGTT